MNTIHSRYTGEFNIDTVVCLEMKWVHYEKGKPIEPFTYVAQILKNVLECNEQYQLVYHYAFGSRYTAEQAVFVDKSVFDCQTEI